ncbi:MAG TPA: manganese efflux pump MntP family protein [Spirochaetota bacterium]|nr:manganese efflux pump MntP family protein [Spirochaetota bacterium]
MITILAVAFGLAMDAFAVSIASGTTIKQLKLEHALRIALFFGGFQAFMPVLGWLAGRAVSEAVKSVDHWIIFGILGFIGGKMIYESRRMKEDEDKFDYTKVSVLLFLSLATSIDALAVGFSFAFLDISIIKPIAVIGGVTFLLSLLGVYLGDRFGHLFESRIEVIGGGLLIGVGIKVLAEHLFF